MGLPLYELVDSKFNSLYYISTAVDEPKSSLSFEIQDIYILIFDVYVLQLISPLLEKIRVPQS